MASRESPETWMPCTWGDLMELHYGKALPQRAAEAGETVVYGTNGPTGRTTDVALGDGPTTVVGRKGAYRGVCQAKGRFWVIDTAFFAVPHRGIDPGWLFRAMSVLDINALDSGSAIPSTRREDVYALPACRPPLDEQQRIAAVLQALDDKIDSNRRLAGLLEEAAATLFRGRFIDFVGVTDLVDSEIGPIPLGWAVRPLQDVVSVLRRGMSPKYVDAGGVCVLNQKCIRDFRVAVGPSRRHDSQARSVEGREVEPGDILVNSTGVGTLGRLAQVRYLNEPTIVDSHVTVVRANEEVIRADFLAMALFAAQPVIEALGEGSTGQTELGRARLGALPILVPPLNIQDEYLRAASALRTRTDGAERESLILGELRDTLLPKLVAGELRVADAEEAVEAA